MKKFNYYAIYIEKEPKNLTPEIGIVIFELNKKIKTLKDIKEVENCIQEQNNLKKVTLISWNELEGEEE